MLNAPQKLNNQSGFGLIEALISLLVISIGLLGIAALQISALKLSSSAHWHNQAVWYAYEITDRINANRGSFAAYADIDTDKSYSGDCENSACTSAAMVDADAKDWKRLVSTLPEGRGYISANGTSLIVSVMWDDGDATTNCTNGEPDPGTRTCFTWTVN